MSDYASKNCFTGLSAKDDMSDDGTANTIIESINTHMANLSASFLLQSNASNNANTAIFNASMQQVAANKAQCNNDHNCMLQQFAMMTTNQPGGHHFAGQLMGQPAFWPQAATQRNFVPAAIPMLAPAQQWGSPPGGGGRGGSRSCN
jgi:hypothetical protein